MTKDVFTVNKLNISSNNFWDKSDLFVFLKIKIFQKSGQHQKSADVIWI